MMSNAETSISEITWRNYFQQFPNTNFTKDDGFKMGAQIYSAESQKSFSNGFEEYGELNFYLDRIDMVTGLQFSTKVEPVTCRY